MVDGLELGNLVGAVMGAEVGSAVSVNEGKEVGRGVGFWVFQVIAIV